MIAHPPCTKVSNAGARHLFPKGVLNQNRHKEGLVAKELFIKLLNCEIPKIAVENPMPSSVFEFPKFTQIIQPWMFGHPYSKRTYLWLRCLPELKPTKIVEVLSSTKQAGNWFNHGGKDRQKNRSKTFPGIANAMADQWGSLTISTSLPTSVTG
jgi:hypothetical protein